MREQDMKYEDHSCPLCKKAVYLPTKNFALQQFIDEHDKVMNEMEPIMRGDDRHRKPVEEKKNQIKRLRRKIDEGHKRIDRITKNQRR